MRDKKEDEFFNDEEEASNKKKIQQTKSNLEVIPEVDEDGDEGVDNEISNCGSELETVFLISGNSDDDSGREIVLQPYLLANHVELLGNDGGGSQEANDNRCSLVNGDNNDPRSYEQQQQKIHNQLPTFVGGQSDDGANENEVKVIFGEPPVINHNNPENLETQDANGNYLKALFNFFNVCGGCGWD